MAQVVCGARANGSEYVQQLYQEREFGNEDDGAVQDVDVCDDLKKSARQCDVHSIKTYLQELHDFNRRDVPHVDKSPITDRLVAVDRIGDISDLDWFSLSALLHDIMGMVIPTHDSTDKSIKRLSATFTHTASYNESYTHNPPDPIQPY